MKYILRIAVLLVSVIAVGSVRGAVAEKTSGPGEFPALQLLPPGSIVRGISLPRYENHRVTGLLTANLMEVLSRHEARMERIQSYMYSLTGETTQIRMATAHYDFRTELLVSRNNIVTLLHPRYSVHAHGGVLHNGTRCGVLMGPVHTVIRSSEQATP